MIHNYIDYKLNICLSAENEQVCSQPGQQLNFLIEYRGAALSGNWVKRTRPGGGGASILRKKEDKLSMFYKSQTLPPSLEWLEPMEQTEF